MLYRIFMQILQMGITASVVILVILCVRGVMHRLPKKYLYLLWAVVGIRLVCPFAAVSPVSIFNLAGTAFTGTIESGGQGKLPDVKRTQPITPDTQPEQIVPVLPAKKQEESVGKIPGKAVPNEAAPVDTQTEESIPLLARYGLAAWLTGMAAIFLWNIFVMARMKKSLEKAVRYQENIYECDNIPSPFVLGIFRPRIYIPFRLDEREREYILKHEQYHIKRRDYIIKPAAFLLTCVYWFHPLVWLSYFLMIRDMEMSCDEYVLQSIPEDIRASYSKSLLGFAVNQRGMAAGLLAFGETDTRKRVKNVLHFKKHKKWAGVIAAVLVAIAGTVCLTNASDEEKAGQTVRQEAAYNKNDTTQGTTGDNANDKNQGTADDNANGKNQGATDDSTNGKNQSTTNDSANDKNQGTTDDSANDKNQDTTDDSANGKNQETAENGKNAKAYEATVAKGEAHGYQVQVIYTPGHPLPDKKDLDFGIYKGKFEIRTYQDNALCAAYPLGDMSFPADGLSLAWKDYDGDGAADDFTLGQGQTAVPALGNFMYYWFFAVDGDGRIGRYSLSTENGEKLVTIPGDYSQGFPCKKGKITYKALTENGTKEQTAELIRDISPKKTNRFDFGSLGVTIALPENTGWVQSPEAFIEGETGVVKYYDGIAETDVTLRFGKEGQKEISGPADSSSSTEDKYWSYFDGNVERFIRVKFYAAKKGLTTVVLSWQYSGIAFSMQADFPDSKSHKDNWTVLAKSAAHIANEWCSMVSKAGNNSFSDSSIQEAKKAVRRYFKKNFADCEIRKLWYDEKLYQRNAPSFTDRYGKGQVIILYSDFYVDKKCKINSLNKDFMYQNFMWVLSKKEESGWKVQTYGY